jgi:hypothetical protein
MDFEMCKEEMILAMFVDQTPNIVYRYLLVFLCGWVVAQYPGCTYTMYRIQQPQQQQLALRQ